jgi:hypothetical protein
VKGAEVFPSRFLNAADLNGHAPVVTIARVELQTVGKEQKPVVYFEGKEKAIVLNRTNFVAIVELTGEDDTDQWPGHRIKLVVTKVDFQGRRVPAIRVEDPREL